MKRFRSLVVFSPLALFAAGCAMQPNMPLVFAQADTFGVTVNAGTTQQSAELTLGYRGIDVAMVPTVMTGPNGEIHQLLADITNQGPTGCSRFQDSLSVLGQFNGDASTSQSAGISVGLGKFFATGMAAKRLSDGFAEKLAGLKEDGTPTTPATGTGPFAAGCFVEK